MTKVAQRSFMTEFEILLARTWESQSNVLSDNYVQKTRDAIASIREYYTFKMHMPSKINYRIKKNRAGYLASFGQRHAYLPYYQLRQISQKFSSKIPKPKDGELTLTLLGGAAAVEVFGILHYFNEKTQVIRKLNLVTIERVDEWDDVRHLYINTLIKDFFRKVSIKEFKISTDLRHPCERKFAENHAVLINTDILMCYNILNENQVREQPAILDNLRYILNLNKKNLLVMLMEPSPDKSIVRVRPFKTLLASTGEVLQDEIQTHYFDDAPLRIVMDKEDQQDLNTRLFIPRVGKTANPLFYDNIKRIAFSAVKKPTEGLPLDMIIQQINDIRDKDKGYFLKRRADRRQVDFFNLLELTDLESLKNQVTANP
jgi:hypothetical protein